MHVLTTEPEDAQYALLDQQHVWGLNQRSMDAYHKLPDILRARCCSVKASKHYVYLGMQTATGAAVVIKEPSNQYPSQMLIGMLMLFY